MSANPDRRLLMRRRRYLRLRTSVLEFVDRFNRKRLSYRSPKEAYSSSTISREVAA